MLNLWPMSDTVYSIKALYMDSKLGHCRSVLNFLCLYKAPLEVTLSGKKEFLKRLFTVMYMILCPTFATSFKPLSIYLKAITLTKVLCALGDIHGRLESRCFTSETEAQRFRNRVIWGVADCFSSQCIQWSKRSFARSWICQGAREKSWQRR